MKFNKKLIISAAVVAVIATSTVVFSQMHETMNHGNMEHSSSMKHSSQMDHSAMMGKQAATGTVLTESGTDPFAVIQEVIATLEANPNTNWEGVDIESLRLHLITMQDMSLNVDVEQSHVSMGFQAIITPTTNRALKSLNQVLSAHPAQMQAETGWDMQVVSSSGVFTITVTTNNLKEVAKIRGLGYIGIMAYGSHHQTHHWAMVSGSNPHSVVNLNNGHTMDHDATN
jgi:hypothetical protein